VAMACQKFLENYCGEQIKIKWPNDIYCNDRKAGGILIESIMGSGSKDNWKWAVIGIGMNINQTHFDAALPNPVSLKQITGKEHDIIELAKELCDVILYAVDAFQQNKTEELFMQYQQQLYKLNEKVRLKKENAVFETTIKGVNLQGQLLVEDVMERAFNFGEVEWIL
jgi:BirA family transcriptional regulator, biotin operon repressor / biotin---[acetyl-CoA-carboxylase] ligase